MFAPLLASAMLLAAAPAAQTDTTTVRYRVDTQTESVADLSGLGGGEQRQTVGMSSFLTIQLVDTTGGRSLRVVVDSMTIAEGSPLPASVADSVRGMTWTGLLAPDGKVTGLKSPSGAQNQQFSSMLNSFFPRAEAHQMETGARWVDTVEVANSDSSSSTTARTVTEWTVAGKEQHAGVEATRLNTTFQLTMNASGETPQGPMDMEGTGTGTSSYFVGSDGTYLGGTSTIQNDMTLSLAASPMPIPVTAHTTTTISQLP